MILLHVPQHKDRCSWTTSGSGAIAIAIKCASHTSVTFATINLTVGCTNFLSCIKEINKFALLSKGICTETHPSILAVDISYSISDNTYTWSTSTSKCSISRKLVVNNKNLQQPI